MLRILFASIVAALLFIRPAMAAAPVSFTNNLLPQPSSLQLQNGAFQLSSSLTVSLPQTSSPRLQAAVLRALRRLEDRTGLPLPRTLTQTPSANLLIVVHSESAAVQSVGEDESYTLTTSPSSLRLGANTTLGALHGLETLVQLVQPQGSGYIVPAVRIQDAPRFRWRGLMIDCGRHFEPIDVLKRNLDAMAAVKLNVFHWHLTEDQGFRIESKRYPRLTQLGSDGLFYTQDQARDLVRYAHDRGIRVVPEFEMPAHSTAWLVAYPELSSGSVPSGIRREFGISEYVIDPTREETYRFIEQFLAEMTTVFPDEYIHIGGDEASAPDWRTNPRILAFMKEHNLADRPALQAYFNQRLLTILNKLHRRMVGWDEVLNPALPRDIVIQSWRGTGSLAKAAQQGFQGFLSAPYYLNMMRPASTHYLADPLPEDTPLTPEQQKLILGGEICMWAEHVDVRSLDSRTWPRAAAIAERFWSPQSIRDVDDMYRRLLPTSLELETLGLQHLTHEGAALRDLAGNEEITALRTFASAFEPVGHDERYKQQHTSQLTPLTSFVDAIPPDPPIKHQLALAAQALIRSRSSHSDGTALDEARQASSQFLLNFFHQQLEELPQVQREMLSAPRLRPLHDRSNQLQSLATVGEQAVQLLASGAAAPTGWKQSSLQQIQAARQPSAMVQLLFLEPLFDLVSAVP